MGKREILRAVENAERESITVNNEWIKNNTVYMAMNELYKGHYVANVAYQLEKLSRRLQQANKRFATDCEVIIKKYSELDEKGQPKKLLEPRKLSDGEIELVNGEPIMIPVDFLWRDWTEKNEQGDDVPVSGKACANIEFEELGEQPVTFDVWKFSHDDFAGAKLTVSQWMALNPIMVTPFTDDVIEE